VLVGCWLLVGRGPQAQANAGAASTKVATRAVKNKAVKTFFTFFITRTEEGTNLRKEKVDS
jgi:hypothetical protein